jgi:hypothetical protein
MTNKELWESYAFYTGELTRLSRQLAFAAAAICWFFRTAEGTFPLVVLFSLGSVVVFFCCDLLQYLVAVHILRWWTRQKEKEMWECKQTIAGEYEKPAWLDAPAFVLFNLKITALISAFVGLGVEILQAGQSL